MAKIIIVDIGKIKPHPNNPRFITEEGLEKLKQSIRDFPEMLEVRPVIVEHKSGHILGGNQRYRAAKELGHKTIPVIYVDTDDKKAREMMLKDNLQFGEWDFDKLKEFASKEELIKWGVEDAEYISYEEDEEPEEDEEQMEDPDGNAIKKIQFNLSVEDYERAMKGLQKVIKKNGLNDNTEAILHLLENVSQKETKVKPHEYKVYVISAGRYNDLPFDAEQKRNYIFCVKNGEKELYEKAGCKTVFETGKLIESRNFALNHAMENNVYCVQLSDDIKRARMNGNFGSKDEINLDEAIKELVTVATGYSYSLLGIPPTGNDFFAKTKIVRDAFCIGDLFVAKPSEIRFDENLTLKEDYDFTLQHVNKGGTIRYQKFIFEFSHYTNKGGAVDYRNNEEEQRNIEYLKAKWGSQIKDNPKRENEILLKIKK